MSYAWLRSDTKAEYALRLQSEGTLYAQIPSGIETPPPEQPLTQIRLDVQLTVVLHRLHIPKTQCDMVIFYGDNVKVSRFEVNKQSQHAIIEALPRSMRQYPLYAELSKDLLLSRYWIKDTETLTHSLMRQILSRFQIAAGVAPAREFVLTEADSFGRCVVRYTCESAKHILRGTKRRLRYINYHRGESKIRYLPEGIVQFQVDRENGLANLEVNLMTSAEQSRRRLFEERFSLQAKRIRVGPGEASQKKQLADWLFSENYRSVQPWEPLGA